MYYFVSDTHLGGGSAADARTVEERFCRWLDAIADDAEVLFLVGDIFDFWFEYNRVVPKGFVRVLGRLASLRDRGVRVVYLTGNHDMWQGDYLQRECGVELYKTPQEFTVANLRLFVAHGDNMNIKGQPMLRLLNWVFRSRVLRFLFAWLIHPDLALKFGCWWSGCSRKSHKDSNYEAHLQPLCDYAESYAAQHKIDLFVFGHMHATAAFDMPTYRVRFMGDWHTRPNYVQIDSEGNIEQKIFE